MIAGKETGLQFIKREFFLLSALILFAPRGFAADHGGILPDRNFMWKVIQHCLANNIGSKAYCTDCPKPLISVIAKCTDATGWDANTLCRRTTEVWDETPDFVALKDIKMCGCPDKGFVHGLVLPLSRVTGIEDVEHRPKGIWKFAWDEALKKIGDQESIVIVANPRAHRSQDQLHIHLVRLANGARAKITALNPIRLHDLNDVWTAANQHASRSGFPEGKFGIALAHDTDSDSFLLVTTPKSPEKVFTAALCPAH